MKIVIVDDDILVASALKTILEAGEDVTVSGTGRDGSDALFVPRAQAGRAADGYSYAEGQRSGCVKADHGGISRGTDSPFDNICR